MTGAASKSFTPLFRFIKYTGDSLFHCVGMRQHQDHLHLSRHESAALKCGTTIAGLYTGRSILLLHHAPGTSCEKYRGLETKLDMNVVPSLTIEPYRWRLLIGDTYDQLFNNSAISVSVSTPSRSASIVYIMNYYAHQNAIHSRMTCISVHESRVNATTP